MFALQRMFSLMRDANFCALLTKITGQARSLVHCVVLSSIRQHIEPKCKDRLIGNTDQSILAPRLNPVFPLQKGWQGIAYSANGLFIAADGLDVFGG